LTAVYVISKLLTAPAALLKAFWEHCLLKLMKEPVEGTAYLRRNELCGHTEHRLLSGVGRNALFCLIPGLLNFIFALPLLAVSAVNLFWLGIGVRDIQTGLVTPLFFMYVLFFYIGVSLWCNLFPLYEDAVNFSHEAANAAGLKKALLPLAASIRAGAFLERYGLNLLIAAAAILVLLHY